MQLSEVVACWLVSFLQIGNMSSFGFKEKTKTGTENEFGSLLMCKLVFRNLVEIEKRDADRERRRTRGSRPDAEDFGAEWTNWSGWRKETLKLVRGNGGVKETLTKRR